MIDFFQKIRIRYLLLAVIVIFVLIAIVSNLQVIQSVPFIDDNFWNAIFYLCLLFWAAYFVRKNKLNIPALIRDFKNKIKWSEIFSIVGIHYLFTYGSMLLIISVLEFIKPGSSDSLLNSNPFAAGKIYDKIYILLLITVLAPLVEELIFRGVILNRLAWRWGITASIIISSAAFGLLHSEAAMAGAILFALLLCLLYFKTNNILLTITAHFVNNFLLGVLNFFDVSSSSDPAAPEISSDPLSLLVYCSLGLLMTAGSLWYVVRYFRKNWPRDLNLRRPPASRIMPPANPANLVTPADTAVPVGNYPSARIIKFEDDWAELEFITSRQVNIAFLPAGVKEGDLLRLDNGKWVLQPPDEK